MLQPISVIDGYDWGFKDHIKTTVLYKHARFLSGNSDDKPYKNIIRPILNLQYRAEGFDVKDIQLYVTSPKDYYKSFIIEKYHENWARENKIDTFIDELVESYVDYGGVLVKDIDDVKPEVVPLQSIAFCDQTDLLAGPFAIKHYYAPNQLLDMAQNHWGDVQYGADVSLEELIALSRQEKTSNDETNQKNETPGSYIEVYEVHGVFPDDWMKDTSEGSDSSYSRQLHIISFYNPGDGNRKGCTLYQGAEKELPFKLLKRDPTFGRCLGYGGAEELFEPQVWVNNDMIRIKGLLDTAAKILYQTNDAAFANRNKTGDLENGEILVLEEGKQIGQLNTTAPSFALFERSIADWEAHAKEMASAGPAMMGVPPTSHTAFRLQSLLLQQSQALHEYRRGKIATFVDEIYKDWIMPYFVQELTKGTQFLAELDLNELEQVADALVNNRANDLITEKILNGETIDPMQIDQFKMKVRNEFLQGGNKKFIEIFKGEMEDVPVDVKINIAAKQKDLSQRADALTRIFQQIIVAPQILDDPRMAKIFSQILENSGFNPVDFYTPPKSAVPPQNPPSPLPPPLVPPGQSPPLLPAIPTR